MQACKFNAGIPKKKIALGSTYLSTIREQLPIVLYKNDIILYITAGDFEAPPPEKNEFN